MHSYLIDQSHQRWSGCLKEIIPGGNEGANSGIEEVEHWYKGKTSKGNRKEA